ncbi:transposase [Paenibacillus periandrae]|uniref:transposase n=1 Tax=Paenibacillus periandrae TaxID=1761741 RepID=UPI001F08C8C3|nr:transposase [Paenibacillus periandrae]
MAKSKWEINVKPKLDLIKSWAQSGLIDRQIAKNLNIAYSTFNLYKDKYSELSEALKKSKEEADYEVTNSLNRAANGFEYFEETQELINGEWQVTKRTKKVQPPNVTAAIFWLKNRDPKNWRDKQHINHSGGVVSTVVDYSHLSDEELEKELESYGDD